MFLPEDKYKEIVKSIPIICVDLMIRKDDKFLLVKRDNEPLKGEWWVVGGRVLIGEDLVQAAKRKALEETNIHIDNLVPVGYYEERFNKSPYDSTIHTISFVFTAEAMTDDVKVDDQSSEWKWSETLPTRFINGLLKL